MTKLDLWKINKKLIARKRKRRRGGRREEGGSGQGGMREGSEWEEDRNKVEEGGRKTERKKH